MFEERAQDQPSAPAVYAWDGALTYGELDILATRLAGYLTHLGIGADVLVPLCFEKSMWTTVAILGVLKAGGGFLLLDPSLPENRLQDMIEQVNPRLVLSSPTHQALASRLAQEVVTISSDFFKDISELPLKHALEHPPASSPPSILYVVFTSGSTGTPKGVVITHQNLASALYHQVKLFGFTTPPRVFDFASYSFDASIFNTFITLAAGGCLCVPSDQGRRDDLPGSVEKLKANVLIVTPSVAQLIRPDKLQPGRLPGLQSVMFCGEAVHITDVQPRWNRAGVLNGYGPSECTPMSTFNHHPSSIEEATCIGKGAGLVTWVVDQDNVNRLLPPGCIGELLLEGPLVGPGYLNDPEKTAAKFINDPLWLLQGSLAQPGRHGRLYMTGDLVRYNEDGSLTFMGRKDAQVKIRGQRVELAEVEHRIQECIPEATQVVAELILPEGEKSSPVLAGFLQMDDCVTETAKIFTIGTDAEDRLAEYLPSYMIPTVFFSIVYQPARWCRVAKMTSGGMSHPHASTACIAAAHSRLPGWTSLALPLPHLVAAAISGKIIVIKKPAWSELGLSPSRMPYFAFIFRTRSHHRPILCGPSFTLQ